jgi:hypothetical protein
MVLTMAVLMVPVLLIVWFFQRTPDEPPLPSADWQATVAQARAKADFTVLAPEKLPQGWRATQARFEESGQGSSGGDEFRLVLLDADNVNLQLLQVSSTNPRRFVTQQTRDGYESGAQKVGDAVWQQYTSADGRTVYLLGERTDSLVLVQGDTTAEALASFAGRLVAG